MIEVRIASLRRVIAVTSMKALNSCRLTWPCDSPNGASGSRYSVSMKPSITISASAGTSRSTVFAFTTLIGAPTSAPATSSSSSVSGSFCTEANVTHGRRAEHHRARQLLEAALAQLFPVLVDAGPQLQRRVHAEPPPRLHLAAVVAHVLHAGVGVLGDVLRQRRVGRDVPARRRDRQRNAVEALARLVELLAGDDDLVARRVLDDARRDRALRRRATQRASISSNSQPTPMR